MPKQSLQRHRNQDHCTGKRPRKPTPARGILHTKVQTYPQFPRGMQQIRGRFVPMTILAYRETLFVQ